MGFCLFNLTLNKFHCVSSTSINPILCILIAHTQCSHVLLWCLVISLINVFHSDALETTSSLDCSCGFSYYQAFQKGLVALVLEGHLGQLEFKVSLVGKCEGAKEITKHHLTNVAVRSRRLLIAILMKTKAEKLKDILGLLCVKERRLSCLKVFFFLSTQRLLLFLVFFLAS